MLVRGGRDGGREGEKGEKEGGRGRERQGGKDEREGGSREEVGEREGGRGREGGSSQASTLVAGLPGIYCLFGWLVSCMVGCYGGNTLIRTRY